MTFQITVASDSAVSWDSAESLLVADLPETLFFGAKKWSLSLTEFNLTQSIANVAAGEIKVNAKTLKIPDSNFTNIGELLSFISRYGVSFTVLGSVITAVFDKNVDKVVLNDQLRRILGFRSKKIYRGDINSVPWNLWIDIPGFYLKWEIIDKQIFNKNFVKAVKHIPCAFKNVECGKTISYKEELPFFLDLDVMEITRIRLQLLKNDGTPLKLLPNTHFQASFAFKSG